MFGWRSYSGAVPVIGLVLYQCSTWNNPAKLCRRETDRIREAPVVRGQRKPACSRPGEHALPKPDSQPGKGRAFLRLVEGQCLAAKPNQHKRFRYVLPRPFGGNYAPAGLPFANVPRGTSKKPGHSPQWKSAPFGYGNPELHFADTAYGVRRPGMKGLTFSLGDNPAKPAI